jgi:hypothetical protein
MKTINFLLSSIFLLVFPISLFSFSSLDTNLNTQVNRENLTGTNPDPLLLNSISTDDIFKGNEDLVMYKPVKLTNTSSEPFIIKTPTETIEIASNSTQEVIIKDKIVDLFSGIHQRPLMLIENTMPTINIQRLIPLDGDELHLSKIQSVTGYRVTIEDDFAEQLDFKINGPVKFRVAKRTANTIVIDITLEAYTRTDFERIADINDADEYTSFFNILVKDIYAPHKLDGQGLFRYTEW